MSADYSRAEQHEAGAPRYSDPPEGAGQTPPRPATPMEWLRALAIRWSEAGRLPDPLLRMGIRQLLRERLVEIGARDIEGAAGRTEAFISAMNRAPIALATDAANTQHYEVPAEFYTLVLGPHRKYSSCYWTDTARDLGSAEQAALSATCHRAGLADRQRILELGCGWGSLTLWMAEHYPHAHITAVSNSHSQRRHIEQEAARRKLGNVEILTCDMNHFAPAGQFDRVVSVEMLEHMRNWGELLRRVASWLLPDGRFFMHVFVHRSIPYSFEIRDAADWMSQYFFSGGMMPSDDLALRFQQDLRLLRQWRWSGTHYARTARAWLDNLDANRSAVERVLASVCVDQSAKRWTVQWRLFFMACEELFGYRGGREWWVSHYLFDRRS